MDELAVYVLTISAGIASAHAVFWLNEPPSLVRSLSKTLPVGLLALGALITGQSPLLITALFACAIGDCFLSREGERHFLSGLASFLTGHLFYIAFFSRSVDPATLMSQDTAFNVVILSALCALVMVRLWPFIGDMRLPVLSYAIAVATMAVVAKAANPGFLVLSGVALFIISDIILAFDRFTPLAIGWKRRTMPYCVWAFYFAGQLLLVYGLILGT
jgi:uncharacterized membrane protein YhhN